MKPNTSLKHLLNEDDNKTSSAQVSYQSTIEGETFQTKVSIDKKGINLEFVPTNPTGEFIHNLSPDEVSVLENSLMTTLAPKFARYKMSLDVQPSKTGAPSVKMLIPIDGVQELIKNIIAR